jgi:outer membrane protein assembly factor BamB
VAYAATNRGCPGVPDGIWALDLESKAVTSWKSPNGAAGPAFGPDGTIYVATRSGELVALEPKTLKVKDAYKSGGPEFTSMPVIFEFMGKTLIAAATQDGRIHIMDTAALATALHKSAPLGIAADALASWQDADGTRWLLAPTAKAILALKIVDQNGAPAIQTGWTSRELMSPHTPMIMNGVVFALSSGEFRTSDSNMSAAQRAQRSSPAVLYALDGATGKELWNSGRAIGSFVHSGGLSAGGSQVYIGTYDGTLYAFGFPIEH